MAAGFKVGMVATAAVVVATVAGYRWYSEHDAADILRGQTRELKEQLDDSRRRADALAERNVVLADSLSALQTEHDALTDTYNDAVRATAVTELLVEAGKLSVVIRSIEGVRRVIPTPYDPAGEVYVDYVVLDGRLWIRRVFDSRTPPQDGLLIEPVLASVNWSSSDAAHGKAVYRSLKEGRWVITVTGDGSLGLAPATDEPDLKSQPPVRKFEPIEKKPAR